MTDLVEACFPRDYHPQLLDWPSVPCSPVKKREKKLLIIIAVVRLYAIGHINFLKKRFK